MVVELITAGIFICFFYLNCAEQRWMLSHNSCRLSHNLKAFLRVNWPDSELCATLNESYFAGRHYKNILQFINCVVNRADIITKFYFFSFLSHGEYKLNEKMYLTLFHHRCCYSNNISSLMLEKKASTDLGVHLHSLICSHKAAPVHATKQNEWIQMKCDKQNAQRVKRLISIHLETLGFIMETHLSQSLICCPLKEFFLSLILKLCKYRLLPFWKQSLFQRLWILPNEGSTPLIDPLSFLYCNSHGCFKAFHYYCSWVLNSFIKWLLMFLSILFELRNLKDLYYEVCKGNGVGGQNQWNVCRHFFYLNQKLYSYAV